MITQFTDILNITIGASNWPRILKLAHNILWRVDRQSHTGLIFYDKLLL